MYYCAISLLSEWPVAAQLLCLRALLPGPRKICLPVFKKNSAKYKKILYFLNFYF
jgi:hypothetical protein